MVCVALHVCCQLYGLYTLLLCTLTNSVLCMVCTRCCYARQPRAPSRPQKLACVWVAEVLGAPTAVPHPLGQPVMGGWGAWEL
jgi:hypothetical protein